MRFIFPDEHGLVQFDKYFEYLESIRGKMPKHVHDFAANPARYSLTHRDSLHDAWVVFVSLTEVNSEANDKRREMGMELRLLGPYHDRYFDFSYREIDNYILDLPERANGPLGAHGDLLYQEFRLTDAGRLCHEALFSSGRRFYVECGQLSVQEIFLKSIQ
jgi:hypothetical protein